MLQFYVFLNLCFCLFKKKHTVCYLVSLLLPSVFNLKPKETQDLQEAVGQKRVWEIETHEIQWSNGVKRKTLTTANLNEWTIIHSVPSFISMNGYIALQSFILK